MLDSYHVPDISVVIPTHNRCEMVVRALESVLTQTHLPVEVIIVDDGSTDGTAEKITPYLGSADIVTVKYIWKVKGGVSSARNVGIAASGAEWISFLDSDDTWLPQKLERQVEALQRFPRSAACVTDAVYLNNPNLMQTAFGQAAVEERPLFGELRDALRSIAYGYHGLYLQTLLVRRDLLAEIGVFDEFLQLSEDSDMFFRVARRTSISYVNLPLVQIDRTPNRVDGLIERAREEKTRYEVYLRLYNKWLDAIPPFEKEIRGLIRLRLSEVHSGWSSTQIINRDYLDAFRSLSTSLRYRITHKAAIKWMLTLCLPSLARYSVMRSRERTTAETLF
jgi:glycosyltransferase involved in cell wall biosynthesis